MQKKSGFTRLLAAAAAVAMAACLPVSVCAEGTATEAPAVEVSTDITYNVEFSISDSTAGCFADSSLSVTIQASGEVSFPAVTPCEGYELTGWIINDAEVSVDVSCVNVADYGCDLKICPVFSPVEVKRAVVVTTAFKAGDLGVKGYFESNPSAELINSEARDEFETTPYTLPTVVAQEGWEFAGWEVYAHNAHYFLGADVTELDTNGMGIFAPGVCIGGIYVYPIFIPVCTPTATPAVTPSAAPTASTDPEVTPTAAPTASTDPEVTPTAAPTASTEPEVTPTAAPTASTEPEVTPTAAPTASTEPEVTATPVITATPTATATPQSTSTATASPVVTVKPSDNSGSGDTTVVKASTPADNSSKIIPQTGSSVSTAAGLVVVLAAALGGAVIYLFVIRKKLNG